jgi:hypothetical protein
LAAPIPGSRGRQIAESIRRFGFTVVLTASPSFATCFLVIGAPVMAEWLKLTAIAVFVVGLCVAAYLANRP